MTTGAAPFFGGEKLSFGAIDAHVPAGTAEFDGRARLSGGG